MENQLITVRLSDGSRIARKVIRIFDEGRRATINYNKAIMIVRHVSWLKSGDVWIDPGLYARYEREGDPELNELLREQAREIAAQGEQLAPAAQATNGEEIAPAAQEWTPEEIASHDEWYAAQGEQLAPAALALPYDKNDAYAKAARAAANILGALCDQCRDFMPLGGFFYRGKIYCASCAPEEAVAAFLAARQRAQAESEAK